MQSTLCFLQITENLTGAQVHKHVSPTDIVTEYPDIFTHAKTVVIGQLVNISVYLFIELFPRQTMVTRKEDHTLCGFAHGGESNQC